MQERFSESEKAIIPIAAFAASGDVDNMRKAFAEGLESGLSINEIKEILVQLYAYCGFPRSLNALGAFMSLIEERKESGIEDLQGEASSTEPVVENSLTLGTETQTKLVGQTVSGALFDFAPAIDQYLKAHLFGDIFAQDVLTWKQRELATISALSNMQGVSSQLQSHYFISMNNGITPALLEQFVSIVTERCGEPASVNAKRVLDNVLQAIQSN